MDKKKKDDILNKSRAYITNAATEIKETVTEGNIHNASDLAVEEARDWVNNGSLL